MKMNSKLRRFRSPGFSYAVVLVTLVALALVGVTGRANGPSFPGVSIENFGKVNDHYYRGSQPDHQQFAELKRIGIKTVIDLRKDNKAAAEGWARDSGLKYFRIPLKASTAATEEQTAYFLSLVNDPENWPVYVHCKGGRHRTGALTAVYRITHDGWTADQAYREMQEFDFNNGFFGGPGAQKKFVYSFYEHFRATATAK
ncbi:MAG TPA: dual specificity protein phosphatase family protein [Pyrinomonadaceae bacterium]|nr:dual specificity protein phosphatase family protein [Pyrinomonadaceae bacterium]